MTKIWLLYLVALQLILVGATTNDSSHHGIRIEEKAEGLKYASDPPGYVPTEFIRVPVISIREDTHDSKVITFGLPEGTSLDLPISSAIVMKVIDDDSDSDDNKKKKDIMRPYNPISSNTVRESFDLLVKIYPDGKAGTYVAKLTVGDMVSFKQTKPNVKKFRYPFHDNNVQTITMIAGGTGIAPMIQALHPILETAGDETKIRLLYGNKSTKDILLKPELDKIARQHPDRFKVHYVIGDTEHADAEAYKEGACANGENSSDEVCTAESSSFDYEYGWINEEKIQRLGFPPNDDGSSIVWVCGVDAMYNSLAGSRFKPLTEESALYSLGYRDDAVWRS